MDIAETYPKTEGTFSLHTKEYQDALKRVRVEAVRVGDRLGEAAHAYESWIKARKAAAGSRLEFSPDEAEAWKETQARMIADRLAQALSTHMADRPEIAAHALSIYFGRRLPELYRALREHVADVELEDDEDAPF